MRAFRLFGTEVILDVSWFVFILMMVALNSIGPGGIFQGLMTLGVLLFLFICVLGHEFAHIFAGNRLGIQVPRIILHIFGGAAMFPTIPYGKKEIFIAVAGPVFSLVLGGIFYGLGFLCPADSLLASGVGMMCYINIVLGAFNLFPIFPMDGGRITRGILYMCMRGNVVRSTKVAVYFGWCVTPILIWLIGFNVWTVIVLAFIIMLGFAELKATHVDR